MSVLFSPAEIPMGSKKCIPFIFGHFRTLLLLDSRNGSLTLFFENEDKFVIYFQNTVSRIGKTTHNSSSPCRIHRCLLLPNYGSHIIHSESFAKTYDFSSYGNHFITSVIDGTSELVSYIYAQTATVMQYSIALRPDHIQIVDIAFVTIMKSYLPVIPIIFQLPIRGRRNDQMDGLVRHKRKIPAISVDKRVYSLYFHFYCQL